jgi:chemotaxis protein MotA
MFTIIGMLVVVAAVVGGYLMERGNLLVLLQPAELLIIGGAATGTLLIANPLPVVINVLKGVVSPFRPSPFSKISYLDMLRMLNELFQFARKNGVVALEPTSRSRKRATCFRNTRISLGITTPSISFATRCECR